MSHRIASAVSCAPVAPLRARLRLLDERIASLSSAPERARSQFVVRCGASFVALAAGADLALVGAEAASDLPLPRAASLAFALAASGTEAAAVPLLSALEAERYRVGLELEEERTLVCGGRFLDARFGDLQS